MEFQRRFLPIMNTTNGQRSPTNICLRQESVTRLWRYSQPSSYSIFSAANLTNDDEYLEKDHWNRCRMRGESANGCRPYLPDGLGV
jgi:hypothetical protein